jgi:PAS domain S-box-containing protein
VNPLSVTAAFGKAHGQRHLPWPTLVLVAGLVATAGVVALLERSNRLAARRELQEHAQIVSSMIERRVGRWALVLSSVRGLYAASQDVSATEFRRFYDSLDLWAQHAGFVSLQFVQRVAAPDRLAFEAAVQEDPVLMAGRTEPFHIRPAGERPEYLVSLYIEPRTGNDGAFGFDAAHDPVRREAFERARDSGTMTASGRLALAQKSGTAGLALRLPIYRNGAPLGTVAQRREAWRGTAAVVLEIERFMQGLMEPQLQAQVALRLHDLGWADGAAGAPDAGNLLFDSSEGTAEGPGADARAGSGLTEVIDATVGGRAWRFVFTPGPAAVRANGGALQALVAVLGLVASLLASRLLQAQAGAKNALEARVAERTAELAAANRSLRAGEERLALALAGGELAIWDWDLASGALVWNDRWWVLRGLPARQTPSLEVWQRSVHPEDLARVMQALEKHLDGQTPLFEVEYRVQHTDGSVRWVLDRGQVVERDASGAPLRMSGTNLDVTGRQQAEEARVQAETARRLASAKDEFVARMSHELRTPLNAVLGFACLLDQGAEPVTQRQRQHIGHIRRAGEHLLALLNDLLDMAAIEAGRLPMQPGPEAPAERLQSAVALLGPQAQEAGVTLEIHQPADAAQASVRLLADGTRLTQVLLNLISNGIKYNRPGGRVDVAWSVQKDCVHLAVRDTGIGLTPAQLDRLYQPFERLSAARSAIPGTGLGLVVTRRLVELMGGRIEVSSEPGAGSCFTVILPVAPA